MVPGGPWGRDLHLALGTSKLPLSIACGLHIVTPGFLLFSRQPVTKNTFRQYRVLGKGGFGEVSAHPRFQLKVPVPGPLFCPLWACEKCSWCLLAVYPCCPGGACGRVGGV